MFHRLLENLTPWQQDALYELWTRFFRLCQTPTATEPNSKDPGLVPSSSTSSAWTASMPESAVSSLLSSATPSRKQSREGISYSFSTSAFASTSDDASTSQLAHISASDSQIPKDDAVSAQVQALHESKEMRIFLARYGGQRLRKVFWQMVKGEHPDAVMLRLLRARKWKVDRAIAVLGSTASWRVENRAEEIICGGELELTKTRGGMNILRNGISYICGATSTGEPVYLIEVGRHFSASQTQDELKRAVILLQETLQMMMPPPTERKIVIFNMNEFGIRNMDWWCVFFMVKTMECFYVETLARVYVHGAPWIFKPIWSILKPLLDPVVRDKIRLTSDPKELEEHVPLDHLPKNTMRGQMDWVFEYPLPQPEENDLHNDITKRDRLQEEYFTLCFEFERATSAVARVLEKTSSRRREIYKSAHYDIDDAASFVGGAEYDEPPELASLKARRDVLATKLRVAWLKLAPYQVGKTKLHRWNVLRDDGTIVWRYPKLDGSVETQVLGEMTSLPALEGNLAAIEGHDAGSAGAAEDLMPTVLAKSAWTGQVHSKGSRENMALRGVNGNKSAKRPCRSASLLPPAHVDQPNPLPAAAKTIHFKGETEQRSTASPKNESWTRPSTSESGSAVSHPSGSSDFHSLSTIHPHTGLRDAVISLEEPDTPASSVHPFDFELAAPSALSACKLGSEAVVSVHPLDKTAQGDPTKGDWRV